MNKFELDGYLVICQSHGNMWFTDEQAREAENAAFMHLGTVYAVSRFIDYATP